MQYTTSGWRKFNAIGCFIMFLIFFAVAMWMEMRNGSPEIVNGVVVGYWHTDPTLRVFFWFFSIAALAMMVAVLLWPGPVKGSVEYKAAQRATVAPSAAPTRIAQAPTSPAPSWAFCPYCGSKVEASFKYCPMCNSSLRDDR